MCWMSPLATHCHTHYHLHLLHSMLSSSKTWLLNKLYWGFYSVKYLQSSKSSGCCIKIKLELFTNWKCHDRKCWVWQNGMAFLSDRIFYCTFYFSTVYWEHTILHIQMQRQHVRRPIQWGVGLMGQIMGAVRGRGGGGGGGTSGV